MKMKSILLSSISLFLMACGASDHAVAIAKLTGDATRGKTLYESASPSPCSSCHGPLGKGGSGPNIVNEVGSETEEFIDVILTGEDSMPAYDSSLEDQEIADIIAYLKSL
jgi:mono/diheme cytochrome c family protein